MNPFDKAPDTRIADSSRDQLSRIRESAYSVLVGRNNCGKSFLLKELTKEWGGKASFLGPARHQNFNLLGYFTPNRNRVADRHIQFVQWSQQQQQNLDNSLLNLQQAVAELSDAQREKLVEVVALLQGVRLEIRHTVDGNSMSQQYISCDGHNISYTSAGFRLITTLVTALLDTDYDTFLIDEPELGIAPEAQGILAEFLFEPTHRARYFSHIKTLVFATHSTLFLDRKNVSNNYIVSKANDEISIQTVDTQGDLNKIHFFLLGNRFETLYLPSAIILVEGKCDHRFIDRVATLRFPNAQFSIIPAHGDSRIKEVFAVARSILGDIQRSPYRDRTFVVLDSVHTADLSEQLVRMGLLLENIVTWPKNGIEYYYPPEIMDRIYGTGGSIAIQGDLITRNGLSYNKVDLLDRVIRLLETETRHHPEFETKLLTPLAGRLG